MNLLYPNSQDLINRLSDYPDQIKVSVLLIFLCLLAFVHLCIYIFVRRLKQKIAGTRDAKFREIITNMLAHIILYDDLEDVDKAVQHFVPRFKKILGVSPAVRELLVRELLTYHGNFTGKTAEILKGIYLGLELDKQARKKLTSWHWERQVEGIHELTKLWIRQDADLILKLTNSKNSTLRMEAQISYLKLSTEDSFRFLDHAREAILEWHQLVLFEVITKTRNVQIPSFGKWLASSNDSVVMLCLKLVDHYQQLETIPQLIGLISHPDLKVRSKAINVLGKLEAEMAEGYFFEIYDQQPAEIRNEILKAMGRISSGNYLDFLSGRLASEEYEIRMNAIRSIW
ncbi:MAG TPA: HEAT repeat domain-containing protein, partial [Sphingobacteriaceae bacterium]